MNNIKSTIFTLLLATLHFHASFASRVYPSHANKQLLLTEFLTILERNIKRNDKSEEERNKLKQYMLEFVEVGKEEVSFEDLEDDTQQYKQGSNDSLLLEYEPNLLYRTAFFDMIQRCKFFKFSITNPEINNSNSKPNLLKNYNTIHSQEDRIPIGNLIPISYIEEVANQLKNEEKKSEIKPIFYKAFTNYFSSQYRQVESIEIVSLQKNLLNTNRNSWPYRKFFKKPMQEIIVGSVYDQYESLVKEFLNEVRTKASLNLYYLSGSKRNSLIVGFNRDAISSDIPFDIVRLITLYFGSLILEKEQNWMISKGKKFSITERKNPIIFMEKILNQNAGIWSICYAESLKKDREPIIKDGKRYRKFGGGGIDCAPYDYDFTIQIWDTKNSSSYSNPFQKSHSLTLSRSQTIFSIDYYPGTSFKQEPYLFHLQNEEYLLVSLLSRKLILNLFNNPSLQVHYCSIKQGKVVDETQVRSKYFYDISSYLTGNALFTFGATKQGIEVKQFGYGTSGLNLSSHNAFYLLPHHGFSKIQVDRVKGNIVGVSSKEGVMVCSLEKPNPSCNLLKSQGTGVEALDIGQNDIVVGECYQNNVFLLDQRSPFKPAITYVADNYTLKPGIKKVNILRDPNYILARDNRRGFIFDKRYTRVPVMIDKCINPQLVLLKDSNSLVGIAHNTFPRTDLYSLSIVNRTKKEENFLESYQKQLSCLYSSAKSTIASLFG